MSMGRRAPHITPDKRSGRACDDAVPADREDWHSGASRAGADAFLQAVDIGVGDFAPQRRGGTFEQQGAQLRPGLILADEFAQVFAAACVVMDCDLGIDKGLQIVRQGNVHCGHHAALVAGWLR